MCWGSEFIGTGTEQQASVFVLFMNCSGVCDVYCVCGASRCRNHIFDLTVKSWSLNPTTTLNTYLHSLFSGRFRVLKPAASDVLFPVLVFDGVFDLSPWTASQL